jgi:hypothetical protein
MLATRNRPELDTNLASEGLTASIGKSCNSGSRETKSVRWILLGILVTAFIALSGEKIVAMILPPLPVTPAVSITEPSWNGMLIRFTITENWKDSPAVAPIAAIRSDQALWNRMHLANWDTVPAPLREEVLETMFRRYQHVVADPKVWDAMRASDWDQVPQPIRVMAFRHMTEYWSGFYHVGADFHIPRRLMADTLSAIVMTESWFEHRAVNTGHKGRGDLGVAQASAEARERMRTLYRANRVDVLLHDKDYFDPWRGTRFVAIWMRLMLEEAGGDLDLAIRAYHSGAPGALNGDGGDYLKAVKRYRLFLRNPPDNTPAWNFLWHQDQTRLATIRP